MNIYKEYLTKRGVERATKKGLKAASQETMKVMRYILEDDVPNWYKIYYSKKVNR